MTLALNYAIITATVVVLLIAVYTDVRFNKIYNAVTVPFAAAGLILNILYRGWLWGTVASLEGIALGLALFILSGLIFGGRLLGAGDCKLFAAVGALQGPTMLLWCILYSLLAGGVIAIIIALFRGILGPAFTRVWKSLYLRVFLKMPMDYADSTQKMRLPYALAICLGTLAALWQYHGQF